MIQWRPSAINPSTTLLEQNCAHNPSTNQVSQANLSNSSTSQYPPDPGEHVLKKSATETGEQDFPVKWFKFICPRSKPRMTKASTFTPVHVAYSPIVFMSHQWTINLHDGYPPLDVLLPEEYILPSIPILCNLNPTMFHFGVDLLHSTTEPQHALPSLASPKGEITSSFSWTSFFKGLTSSTSCDPTLANLNQVKLLCETEFCITKSYFVWYIQQLIVADTTFSVPRSSSYTHQVSDCHSNLVTTPSSSIDLTSESVPDLSLSFLCRIFLILDKLKIEMTKDSLYHAGKNGEHSYGENLCNAGKNGEHSCVENSMEIISTHTTSTSLVVPIRAYKRLNIFAILSIDSFLLDLNTNPPKYIMHSATM